MLRLLHDIHSYPHPDFVPRHSGLTELNIRIDRAYAKFLKASVELSAALPDDAGWYVLPTLMAPRITKDLEATSTELANVELLVRRIAANPNALDERPPTARGRPVADGEFRLIVQAICWYIQSVEQEPIRNALDETKQPSGRAGRIVEATCAGMGLQVTGSQIFSQIRDVMRLDLKAYGWWDLRQVLPTSE